MPSSPRNRPTNLAGRMGRWSATHRKAAIFGWFGFVIVAVFVGDDGQPEQDLRRRQVQRRVPSRGAGARPVRACGRRVRRSSCRAATSRSTTPSSGRRSRTRHAALRRQVRQERRVAAARGRSGHPGPPRGAREVRDRGRLRGDRGSRRPGTRPRSTAFRPGIRSAGRAVRRRQRQQGGQQDGQRRPRKGRRALHPDHADHPDVRVRHAWWPPGYRC